jgi:hypothetical protein
MSLIQRLEVSSQHMGVPFATLSFSFSQYILIERFIMLIRDGSPISQGRIPVGLLENEFQ